MKKILFTLALVAGTAMSLAAQSVGIGTTTPNSSAILDVSSTSKGMLLPRMSLAQRNAIVNPVEGLTIFNTDDQCTDIFDGANWIKNCGYKQTGTVVVSAENWIQKADLASAFGLKEAVGFSIGIKGYIGTGSDQATSNYKQDFWEYDTTTNAWTQKANFGGVGRNAAVGFSIGTKGYIGTGLTSGSINANDFWEYDPSLNTWTQKASFGGTARSEAVGFSIGTKGYIGTGATPSMQNDFWEYDPSLNSWTQKANFGGTARADAVGFSIANKGYIGTGSGPFATKDFWEYDPTINNWTQKADVGNLDRTDAVGFNIGGKGYIGTGASSVYHSDFWEYDPAANSWTQKSNFPTIQRTGSVGFSIGNKGYLGTGIVSGLTIKDFWVFNPAVSVPAYSSSPFGSSQIQLSDGIWTKTLNSVTTNNNVGIGLSASANPLEVNGKIKTTSFQVTAGAGSGYLLTSDAAGNASWAPSGGYYWTASGGNIYNNNAGNIGIGTSSPGVPLTFSNTVGDKISLYGNAGNHYGFGIQGALLQIHSDVVSADIAFGHGTSSSFTERMRIKGNGNVGIGTTNPTRPLSFPPSLGEKILLYPGGVGEVGIGVYGNELRLHADNPGAKVSFGTQTNAGVFTEAGKFEISGGYALSVFGNIWANGTTYASDERFKQNITPISSPLQKLLQINGVEYEMKTNEFAKNHFISGRQIGLLAQNVEKIVPEAVNEKDGYKGVDYARLVPLLIEAIKEQQQQIDELKKLVEQFTKK